MIERIVAAYVGRCATCGEPVYVFGRVGCEDAVRLCVNCDAPEVLTVTGG